MLAAPRFAHTIQPGVKRAIVILNAMVTGGDKFVWVMIRNFIDVCSASYRLLRSAFAAQIYFNMHHIMLLDMLWVIVFSAIEDNITRLHLWELQLDGKRIKLVALIAWTQLETEMLSEIVNGSSYEGAAVEKERSIEQRVIWLSISLGIWHANILLTLLDEALSQPLLEFRRSTAILDLYPWNGLRLRQFLLHILLVVLL